MLHALQELLEPRILQTGPLVLQEDDEHSSCPPTRLEKSGQTIALRFADWEYKPKIRIPTNRWLFPLFDIKRDDPPVARSCDYVIFHVPNDPADENRLFVFLCELKSGKPKGAAAQLRNGMLLAEYALTVAQLHGRVHSWPQQTLFRGIVFAGSSPGLRGTTRVGDKADYVGDAICPDLRVATLRPGSSYPLQYFCA
ncbi:MAG: hypothetical protein HC927_10675 [Deltaproteobacteria bacterium]|nr:hypothetical protein [Deltaproteobacteria bacterium]